MEIGETLYVTTRDEWREWLEDHHDSKSEIWLVAFKKATGKPSLPYNDAVEEALCFGWIDSIRKSLDDESAAQRYTPRRPGSGYSQINKERLARLLANGKVIPSVVKSVEDIRPEDYQMPADIIDALKADKRAWDFFKTTSPAYQRIRVAYVDGGRGRPGEFEKRLENLIEKSARGTQFGHNIEDYY